MTPQMPAMPGMPIKNNEAESANSAISSSVPVAPEMDVAGSDDLSVPEFAKPIVQTPEDKLSNFVPAPKIPKNGIDVVASRNGFYGQERKSEGASFKVRSMDELGLWMTCVDPDLEKKRLEIFKNKKAKNK